MEDEIYLDKEQSVGEHVSRKRSRSSSSSSTSSEESSPDKRRKRRSNHVSDAQFEFPSQQVAFLTNLISQKHGEPQLLTSWVAEVINGPNNNTTNELGLRPPPSTSDADNQQLQLSELSTTLKDPPFPKSDDKHLEKITQLQRFKCNGLHAIRFSEAQKKYDTTPGFIKLNVNDELRRFNASRSNDDRLYLIERTFAALSNAILTQKDELRTTLQGLVDWSNDKSTTLTP
ncbi:jg9780 [Pararge aegeria aegeria]|uniref:Jg9780 protein n=1 Tax=Pararge aegeria aegeria TaxID=348720 RepID=A0A8S4QMS7_9NEOP|nr:jg9780 [Pararge aegeria aegeria]